MVETNILLGLAFSLIANFTNIVPVSPSFVPTRTNDLKAWHFGTDLRPLDVYLEHKSSARFWIYDGVVNGFESPVSYFSRSGGEIIPDRFKGTMTLSSNQVVELATRTIERLVQTGNPIRDVVPMVEHGPHLDDGCDIPFYLVTWQITNDIVRWGQARIEIDARTGQIVELRLWHPRFFDYAFAAYMSNRVYKPDPQPEVEEKVRRDIFPFPATNQVAAGIRSWRDFCHKVGADPGEDTTIDQIDWDRTFVFTNHYFSHVSPVCQVWFRNGEGFEYIDEQCFGHYSKDACHVGTWDIKPSAYWERFRGRVTKRWEDLASGLEEKLVGNLGLSRRFLRSLSRASVFRVPKQGEVGIARCVVEWKPPNQPSRYIEPTDLSNSFVAEFDLERGTLTWISIDPRLLGWREAPVARK